MRRNSITGSYPLCAWLMKYYIAEEKTFLSLQWEHCQNKGSSQPLYFLSPEEVETVQKVLSDFLFFLKLWALWDSVFCQAKIYSLDQIRIKRWVPGWIYSSSNPLLPWHLTFLVRQKYVYIVQIRDPEANINQLSLELEAVWLHRLGLNWFNNTILGPELLSLRSPTLCK